MSNLKTPSEHRDLDGSPWADFDAQYPTPKTVPETTERPEPPELPPLDYWRGWHHGYEEGYKQALDEVQKLRKDPNPLPPGELTHDPGRNPF